MAASLEVGELERLETELTGSPSFSLYLFWRHRWLVLLGAVAGCVLGFFRYARAIPIYESSAQVLVVNKTQNALPAASISESETQDYSTSDYLATHMALIRSSVIVGAAVQQAKLANLPSFAGGGNPTEAIIQSLKVGQLMIDRKPTNILELAFQSTHAEDIPIVLKAIIDSYQHFLSDRYKSGTDETAKLITEANRLLEDKIAKKQREYNEFLAQQPPDLWRGKGGLNAAQERLVTLEAKRSALRLRKTEIQGRIEALEKALNDGRFSQAELIALMAQKPDAGGNKEGVAERLMLLELQEKKLSNDYGPDHPQLRSVREQLAQLREWTRQGLKLELENIQLAIASVNRLIQEEQQKAKPLHDFEQKLESYRTDITRSQMLFDAVAKRLDEISILKSFTGGYSAEIINPPSIGVKVAPKIVSMFAPTLFLGLLVGLGLAYLAELSDKSFRTPEEIRRHLHLPVLGHVPFFRQTDEEHLPAAGGLQVAPALCTVYRPKSGEAEAYRGVRTALFFNRQGDHTVIQVTSPDIGDGKSTLIANLAVSMAQAEKKVILIDADFRRPRLHKLFNCSVQQGLASVMSGEAELNDVIQTTPIPGLSLLPCGPIPPNPAELLSLPRFKDLLAYLREKYDYVLVDTPPLLAVTDPCVVAPHVDGVVLTLRISKNVRLRASRAREILTTLGANVIGIVVNGLESDAKGYGYGGYRYGSRYYYYNYYDLDVEQGSTAPN